MKKLKDEFIPIIKEKIGERFDNVLEDAALILFHFLNPHYGTLAKTALTLPTKI